MKLQVELTTAQRRQAALVRNGVSPKGMSLGRGTQVQRDRKHDASKGYAKHKCQHFD